MASLVADYSDSEDESYEDTQDVCLDTKVKEEIKEEIDEIKQEATDIEEVIKQEAISESTKSSSNFFIPSNNTNDDDDSEEDTSSKVTAIKTKKEVLPNPMNSQNRLPGINDASSDMTVSSVFINQFERAEQAKNSILERHVRMTEAAPKKPANKPMCWKFKKGKCLLGKNCRFFHDTDTISSDINNSADVTTTSNRVNCVGDSNGGQRSAYHPAAFHDARRRPIEVEPVDDDNYMASMKKRKRFGINDALMPPKKAYDSLLQMRQKERPWTMPGAPS